MIISVDFEYLLSTTSLLVSVVAPNNNILLDLSKTTKTITLNFELPLCNQLVDLKFCCKDIRIVNHPLTINNIVLDNFYQFDGILYRGKPSFDQKFLSLAKKRNMHIDPTASDSNRLDFTGELVYTFRWPFYKNVFQ